MEVMQEGRLIHWNFVKWQFWGCKFRRQFCQLCVTSQKTANINSDLRISLPQCIVLQSTKFVFKSKFGNYKRKLRKHDYYSLFLWHKKKTTTNKKTKMYLQGPITPDNLLYILLFLPKNALMAVAGNWENTFFNLNIAIQGFHSSSWKNFLWQVDYFSRARTSSSRRVHVIYWERVSFPPVAICHVSFNMVE